MENVVIIGGGPAGLTAAVYAARAGLKPLIIEGSKAGGQLMLTTGIENFPGFDKGILGSKLIDNIHRQAERFGARYITEDVTKVNFSKSPFKIYVGKEIIETKTVIISTGANTRWLGLESEQKLIGRGVSSCAICDAYFFKDKEVVVVGGGDSAMEESLQLTKFASKVTIIHRRDQLKASKIMQDEVRKNKKITFAWNSEVQEVLGVSQNKVTGVKIKNNKTGKASEIKCEGVFIAIGRIPNTDLFKDFIKLDHLNYIITKGKSTATNVPGIYACGDVQDRIYKQAVTAAGTGCMAALEDERFIKAGE